MPEFIKIGNQSWRKDVAPKSVLYASELDKPQKEDMDITAETTAFVAMDLQEVALMLVYALEEIEQLKAELEVLRNG